MSKTIFISGIDTDAGKTYATAWLASKLIDEGKTVITQKFIQTGNDGYSEDIQAHNRLCKLSQISDELRPYTAPIIFTYPASAQLAARIDNREIDLSIVEDATRRLSEAFDYVLIEGAGGLMVPITDDYFTIDYVKEHNLPLALVTNSHLGSINHTILSLEAIKARGITMDCVLYNTYFDKGNEIIAEDTHAFLERYLAKHFPGVKIYDVPVYE